MKESTKQWWKGTTPRQVERRTAALKHPLRSALLMSAGYFVLMWAFTGFSREPVVLVLWIVGSFAFGFGMVWYARRKTGPTDG